METSHFESLYPPNTRFDEIEKIIQYIKEGNSCQIISFPGVGRSNLLGFLTYNKKLRQKHLGTDEEWFHFVLVHFAEIRKRPHFDALKLIFLSLVDSLRERELTEEYQKASEIFKESLSFNDELVLFQGLKRAIDLLALEKKFTIVFLFDRLEEYVPMLTSEFFSNLRILRSRAKYRFSVVFSLNRPLEELLEPSLFADYYEFVAGHTIYLPLIDKPGLDFRLSYLEKTTGKPRDERHLDEVLQLTAGHMKLTRLGVEILLAPHEKEITLSELLLAQKPIQGALAEIWHSLSPAEQTILEAVSKKQETENSKQEAENSSYQEYGYLEQTGLLQNGRITIPLLQMYIQHLLKKQAGNTQQDHITYNPNTNDIVKGDVILSDNLTAGEFKLLRFLLEHQDRVLERDDIINAVWGESASTAGVTDQAVDQLIFRLRRKVEDDPNSPKHLQTVKGRGFRFLS